MPDVATRTWTRHTFTCQHCGLECYASQESIELSRKDYPDRSDEEIVDTFEFCLRCADGDEFEGERLIDYVERVAPAPKADYEIVEDHTEPPQEHTPKETLLGFFLGIPGGGSLRDLLISADTARKLGYVPEVRLTGYMDGEFYGIELFTADVPSLIAALRGSLDESAKARDR